MTDHPIIFSTPMVSALIRGTKTQTRRVLKWQNSLLNGSPWRKDTKSLDWNWNDSWIDPGPSPAGNLGPYMKLPYGGTDPSWIDTVHRVYPKHQVGDRLWVRETWTHDGCADGLTAYRADGAEPNHISCRWRSPIHMPRRLSRLTLTITHVQIRRLKDIGEADAMAEGVSGPPYMSGFISLWNSINGADAWDKNPWVIVTSFTTDERNTR